VACHLLRLQAVEAPFMSPTSRAFRPMLLQKETTFLWHRYDRCVVRGEHAAVDVTDIFHVLQKWLSHEVHPLNRPHDMGNVSSSRYALKHTLASVS